MQNLVLLPDANELPDANTLGTGIQRLTLAEQDCRFRMNNEMQCQNAYVRAEVSGLIFRDKASQPC